MTGPLWKPNAWLGKSCMWKSRGIEKAGYVVKGDGLDVSTGAYVPEAREYGPPIAACSG